MTAPGAASPTTSWFSAAALVALSATFSLQAMADDTKPMTAVQIQQAQESADAMTKLREAETKSLDAERKRLEAQIALDEAKKKLNPAAPDSAAQAVAAAKTQKEVADAEKAAAESRIAAFKSKYGGVPDSGIAGEVTLGDKAGALEMALLAYRAVATVADGVAKVVKAKVVDKAGSPVNKNASLYAFAAAQVPDFQAVASFRVQRAAVSEALRRASEAAKPKFLQSPRRFSHIRRAVGVRLQCGALPTTGWFRATRRRVVASRLQSS